MPGYSLLPTLAQPTSRLTLRLSSEEMKERNEWIVGAFQRQMPVEEIAYEVGLSVVRVKQIITPPTLKKRVAHKFRTPYEAARADFWVNTAHSKCRPDPDNVCCNDCWGKLSVLQSEYDENGWPYEWAMYGQEKFIAACS